MTNKACPHCRQPLPRALVWRSLFAGQTAHSCPACRKRFRLTYTSKRYVAFLNVALVLGLTILVGYAMYGELAPILGFAALYLAAAAVVLLVLPLFARYEKTSAPYR